MANANRKCKFCGEYKPAENGFKTPAGWFCCLDHAIDFADKKYNEKLKKRQDKARKIIEKNQRKITKERKEKLMTFTAKMAKLQKLVNQCVREVIYPEDSCYTCGAVRGSCKFDAGHFIPVGAGGGDRRRFMHENIRPQCSVKCNVHGSGMRAEYRQRLIEDKGLEWVEWLECESNHPTLKEQFPTHQSWLDEIARYRKIIRDAGLRPVV